MNKFNGDALLPELNGKDTGFQELAVSAKFCVPVPIERVTVVAVWGNTVADKVQAVFGDVLVTV